MAKTQTKSATQDPTGTTHLELIAILKTLKSQLKAKGHTYADLAEHLKIAEVTVKRLFTGRSLSLKLIFSICDFLNVSFFDVAAIAKDLNAQQAYVLSKEQDLYFSENPSSYFIFIHLYRRVSKEKILSDWNLDETSFFKLLRAYEKLGLIELFPKNNFKFKMSGLIHVPQARLRKVLQKYDQLFLQYIHSQTNFADKGALFQSAEVLLSEEHIEEFKNVIKDTLKKFKEHAFVDETMLPKSKTQSVRLLLAFAPYESRWT